MIFWLLRQHIISALIVNSFRGIKAYVIHYLIDFRPNFLSAHPRQTTYTIAKALTERKIPTPTGKEKWHQSTIKSILTNEKYKGSALLQKKFTTDFLTKK